MDKPFVAVARTSDIVPGAFRKVIVEGRPFIVANVDGRFYAVEDLCSHEDYPLSYGCLDGDRIKCSLHGSRFSLRTGEPMEEPADGPIATFRVETSGGEVWLDPTRPTN
jgi:3-phenylpropionate/trans-cinnamate dioxygenase ferredoxin subunit